MRKRFGKSQKGARQKPALKHNKPPKYSKKVRELMEKDGEIRAARLAVNAKLEIFESQLADLPQTIAKPFGEAFQRRTITTKASTVYRQPSRMIKRQIYIGDDRPSYNQITQAE